ncbi:metalloprotease PmbA [Pseudaeromonas sp. ZJS20]|uniref:metalloprotease PmbA n=1 Tax=Pseudaeromonas aegiceratis TaxID=3153928 RepID=UPI00390C81F5
MTLDEQIRQEQAQLETVVADALALAQSLGADSAEISISKQTGISVNTRGGEVENIEFNKDGALGIAVYRQGCKGSSSTTDLSPAALGRCVEAALEIARHTACDPYAGLAEADWMAWDAPQVDLLYPAALDPAAGIALASACERHALGLDPRIKHSDGASFSSHTGIKVYGNTHGFVKGYAGSRHSLSCVLIGEQNGDMERDYSYSSCRDLQDLWSPARIAEEAVLRTVSRLGGRKVKTCQVPVLFAPEAATSLFGHLVAAISGGNLYRKSSFLLDALGQSIFPEWLTVFEQAHLAKGLASSPFDAEGVRTRDRAIIEQGRLATYLLTSYSGRKLGLASTGHAGGIHNWQVQGRGESQEQLLKQMGTGLLVTELMGQGVNIVTGDYSRGAAGFWVENGEIAYPVQEITIAGNLKQMFANLLAVGADVDSRSSLLTGSVLVDSMKLAGS